MRTVKTLIRLGRCPGWSESSLGAQSLCWFCHIAHLLPLQLLTSIVQKSFGAHFCIFNRHTIDCNWIVITDGIDWKLSDATQSTWFYFEQYQDKSMLTRKCRIKDSAVADPEVVRGFKQTPSWAWIISFSWGISGQPAQIKPPLGKFEPLIEKSWIRPCSVTDRELSCIFLCMSPSYFSGILYSLLRLKYYQTPLV